VSGFKEGNHSFLPLVIVGFFEKGRLVHNISFFTALTPIEIPETH